MTDDSIFRPDSARRAERDTESDDPAREFLDESVARPEPWPEPRPAVRDQPPPRTPRGAGAGDVLRGAASLAFTAYIVNEVADEIGDEFGEQDGGYSESG